MQRLAQRLLHPFGHLPNLPHASDPSHAMYGFFGVEDLDAMTGLTAEQQASMRHALPLEAYERTISGSRWRFVWAMLKADLRSVAHAVARANPLRLAAEMPTLITAAPSVITLLFFSPEMWDGASTVELYQLLLFSCAAITVATIVRYRAFAFGTVLRRGKRLAESTVVTGAATLMCLVFTLLFLYLSFALLAYLGIVTSSSTKRPEPVRRLNACPKKV